LIDIEVIPVNKGLSSRIFQPDDINLSFLSNAAIQLKLSMHNEYSKYDEFRHWLNGWLIHFDIGKSIDIINLEGRGVYTIEIIDVDGSRKNLKDLGFGISQILSILLSPYISDFKFNDYQSQLKGELIVDKFEILDKQPVYYLEEPESNLHPNFQSKLMELFIDINKRFGIRFIIETHSEYMIRKLQNLVAQKVVKKEQLQIYYFNSDKYVSTSELKVKQIIMRDDGIMSNGFGPGFYDEAVRLTVELLKIENYN
jgi:predicted ATPase